MNELVPLVVATAFAFGACVGSFLNVVIYRLPRGMSVARPSRSFCPMCRAGIPWYRNIPLVSWVWLNGKCGDCSSAIPVRYLVVELATAALFAGIAMVRVGSGDPITSALLVALLVDLTVAALLVAITVIDFQHAIIPDPLTVPWVPLVVAAAAFEPSVLRGHGLDLAAGTAWPGACAALAGLFVGVFPVLLVDFLTRRREEVAVDNEPVSALPDEDEEYSVLDETRQMILPVLLPAAVGAAVAVFALSDRELGPGAGAALASLAGAGFGVLFVWTVRFVFSIAFGREAMGLGDAKFLALAGAVLGAEGALGTFVLACALGSVPAFVSLLARIPVATCGLLLAASAPLFVPAAAASLGEITALAVLMPVPLVALVLFLRRLRRGDVVLSAMPFGPFLAVAAVVLLTAYEPIRNLLDRIAL